jgi:BMFP domain-containing protein YqiC
MLAAMPPGDFKARQKKLEGTREKLAALQRKIRALDADKVVLKPESKPLRKSKR